MTNRLLVTAVLTLAVAGCRADAIALPAQMGACGEPGCRRSFDVPVDAVVFEAIDDASQRIVVALDDADARQALLVSLTKLRESLKANRTADARTNLAAIYVRLDGMRVRGPGDVAVDLPDVAALRLALVPVTNALGVTTS